MEDWMAKMLSNEVFQDVDDVWWAKYGVVKVEGILGRF